MILERVWKDSFKQGSGLKQDSTRQPETQGRQEHSNQTGVITYMYVYSSRNTKHVK